MGIFLYFSRKLQGLIFPVKSIITSVKGFLLFLKNLRKRKNGNVKKGDDVMTEITNNINKLYCENNILTCLPEKYYDNYIYLLVRDPHHIFSYWEIKDETQNHFLQTLGPDINLILRVFKGRPDANNYIFRDIYDIGGIASYHIDVIPNTTFFVQIGYLKDNIFHPVMTSNTVTTPRDTYSDVLDEDWMALEEYYRGLRKISFNVHGSPFIHGQKSVLVSSKLEKVSSNFLVQQDFSKENASSEAENLHETESFEVESAQEDKLIKTTSVKEKPKSDTSEVLHPKTRENISKPPDKITEEPVKEQKTKEINNKDPKKKSKPKTKTTKKTITKKTTVKKTAAKKKTVAKKSVTKKKNK